MSPTLVDLALAAPTAPAFERAALALLQREIGMDVAFFAALDGSPPTVAGLDPARVRAAMSRARYARELFPVKRAALAARGVAVDTAVLGEARVRGSAYHRHMAAPLGGRHSLMAYLALRGRVIGAVMMGRCSVPFRDSEVRAAEDLLPSLTLARASFGAPGGADLAGLTAREREVLGYLCLGYTNREIGLACATSPNTVRNQLASVFAKIGASTRAEAVAIARG